MEKSDIIKKVIILVLSGKPIDANIWLIPFDESNELAQLLIGRNPSLNKDSVSLDDKMVDLITQNKDIFLLYNIHILPGARFPMYMNHAVYYTYK